MLKQTLIASVSVFLLALPAFSQDTTSEFKPQAGNITTEVQLNFFTGASTISLNQIKGRYFLSPTSAVRLGINFSNNSSTANEIERNSASLGIAPGIEKHFAGTERLSPYVGAEVFLNKSWASEKGPNFEVINGTGNGNRSFLNYGLRAVAGADYYVARRLFLGVEFGFGFTKSDFSKVERKQGGNTITLNEESNSTSFGINTQNGIRLGFVF